MTSVDSTAYLDLTPTTADLHFAYSASGPSGYHGDSPPASSDPMTRFVSQLVESADRSRKVRIVDVAAPTGRLNEECVPQDAETSFVGERTATAGMGVDSRAFSDHVSQQRSRLLAMKFGGYAATPGLLERLAILDVRLNRMVPRVTDAQVTQLERAAAELDRLSGDLDRLLSL